MKRLVVLAVLGTVLAGGWSDAAQAAWCGTTATVDRPQVVGGPYVHLVYAFPSDGADRSATVAQTIDSDVREIDTWWRGQDPTRTPRFDLFRFACGLQPDISTVRLLQSGAELAPVDGGWEKILAGVQAAGFGSPYGRYVIYYDGPVADPDICGAAGGLPDRGPGFAVTYVNACVGVPLAPTTAHELLHALGAVPDGAARQTCPGDSAHVCDSEQDILYPFVTGFPFTEQLLDVGRDDYYGHPHQSFDIQDSAWLRRLDAQVPLAVAVTGGGTVTSLQPGPACTATCTVDWDGGSSVQLEPVPAAGQRFVRWGGSCSGAICTVRMTEAKSVTALFAPARFGLAVGVAGRGVVHSTPSGLVCRVRCSARFTSFQAVRLRAAAQKGWRFRSWGGACAGTRPTCSVPMRAASQVRATFVRRR